MSDCVFCQIVAGTAPARFVASWPEAIAIHPLDPVTPGHLLILPSTHVRNAAEDPNVTAAAVRLAAVLAGTLCREFNLITSAGAAASQTVAHLHWHLVPRREGDGLLLPWTSQQEAARAGDV